MLTSVLWFALGLVLLIKGGDWFVDGAVGIARRLHVPDLLIGATVVSIGTTLPEVMVSATSAAQGHGAMAYGNAIGSVICNTSLIAALTIAIRPSAVDKKALRTPVIFFFASAALYAFKAYSSGAFTRSMGIILLCIFLLYMAVLVRQAVRPELRTQAPEDAGQSGLSAQAGSLEAQGAGENENAEAEQKAWKMIFLLILGAALIAYGADLLVEHGTSIARALGVPETVIALTFVALGTSLPELVTAVTSLVKGHSALSLGNICGANLFNLVLVSGLSVTIGPFRFQTPEFSTMMLGGKEVFSSLVVDTPLMFLVMGLLTIPALKTGRLSRWQGIILLCLYTGFCIFQFV